MLLLWASCVFGYFSSDRHDFTIRFDVHLQIILIVHPLILCVNLSDTLSNSFFIIRHNLHIRHLELILGPLAEMIHHLMSLDWYEPVLQLLGLRLLIPIARLTVYVKAIRLYQFQFIQDSADVKVLQGLMLEVIVHKELEKFGAQVDKFELSVCFFRSLS